VLDQLLAAVHAAPDDDAPRRVYADALTERGDPQGELITLQCLATRDAAQQAREAELIAAYGTKWLGALAPVIANARFERGFLAGCWVIKDDMRLLRSLVGHPLWSTVRELRGSALVGLHPVMRGLRTFWLDEYWAHLEGAGDFWNDLFVTTPRNILELHCRMPEEWDHGGDITATPYSGGVWTPSLTSSQIDVTERCAALPVLRKLVLDGPPALWAERMLASVVAKRLEVLAFSLRAEDFDVTHFAAGMRDAPTPNLELTLWSNTHQLVVRLKRGGRGYERVSMAISLQTGNRAGYQTAPLAQEACQIFAALPPGVTELRVALPEIYEPRDRIRAAAKEVGRLAVCEVG
jgi:uncharacterized protein (TIGR02996 family)